MAGQSEDAKTKIHTVGELIDALSHRPLDLPVVFSIPGGGLAVGVDEIEKYEDAVVIRSRDNIT